MENLSKITENINLASLANQTEYGLEYYLRKDFGKKTKKYIEGGIQFLTLLKNGAKASQQKRLRIDQLYSLKIYKGLKNREDIEEFILKITKAIKLLVKIKNIEIFDSKQVIWLQKLFSKLGEPYRRSACSSLSFLVH